MRERTIKLKLFKSTAYHLSRISVDPYRTLLMNGRIINEKLSFGFQVARSDPLPPRRTADLAWSDLSLEMELYEIHFSQGRLMLQCVAEVAGIYQEDAVLALDSAREPVPERGKYIFIPIF